MTLIKQEDAIEMMKFLLPYREYWKGTRKVLYKKEDIIKALMALPPADNPLPQGKWIDTGGDSWVCSNCGVESCVDEDFRVVDKRAYKMNFCHYCGADMRGDVE